MELNKLQKGLLGSATIDLIEMLVDNPQASELRQMAFRIAENGKEVQVQIVVQRNESEFLEDFQTAVNTSLRYDEL